MSDVEEDLRFDLMAYGSCFYKIVDGKRVRIEPHKVYIRLPWWRRLWLWIRRRVQLSGDA